jgi:hypothetical protein
MRRSPLYRTLAVATAAVLGVAGFVPAARAEQPNGPATAAPACATPGCVRVDATLDKAPAVGGTAELSWEVVAEADVDDVRIEVEFPASLAWRATPGGYAVGTVAAVLPEDTGGTVRTTTVLDLRAHTAHRLTATIVGHRAGPVSVRVRATAPAYRGARTPEQAYRMILASVGTTPETTFLGLREQEFDVAERVPAGTPPARRKRADSRPVPTGKLAKPFSDDPARGPSARAVTSCATGRFEFEFPAGVFNPAPNLQVQVWDADSFGGDDLLVSGVLDGNGGFRLCFDNNDISGGQDVYLRYVTENGLWSVFQNPLLLAPYVFRTATTDNLGNGRTADFGRTTPQDQLRHRAVHAFDTGDTAAAFTPGDCWDERDHDCRPVGMLYPDTDQDNVSQYRPNLNWLGLEDAAPDDPTLVAHEIGHAVMDDVYDDNFPSVPPSCAFHEVTRAEDRVCAWVEGFADWYGAAVNGAPVIVGFDIEVPTWGTPDWDNGDTVEGRVAGALWDLLDPANEIWDRYTEPLANVWDTFLNHRSTTFEEYWRQRGQDGRDVGTGPLGALYQNTIDYGYRAPLADGPGLTRPRPVEPHNYRYDTTTVFWSVVALRPPAGADYDLRLYDDPQLTQMLGASVQLGDTVDFVAVDSNHRPLGDYYPQVRTVTGTGDYQIDLSAQARQLIPGTPAAEPMAANDVVAAWDVCTTGAEQVTVTVTPSDPGQNAELFLMASDPNNAATTVQNRGGAAASAVGAGPGQPETVTFQSTGADCYGLVLVNRAGAGTYTVTRS